MTPQQTAILPAGDPPTPNHTLPRLLEQALSRREPGSPVPPGPRVNSWDSSGAWPAATLPDGVKALLEGLWRSPGHHLGPNGTTTRIRQRPVPSAGGTYPVQTHLVIGDLGSPGLDPGLYVYDHERDVLIRRRDEQRSVSADSWLVFTVQPGRSFGRYRHRAWPLWIADAAYALAAAEFLLVDPVSAVLGPAVALRELLAVARGSDTGWWLSRGLAPEIPLAGVRLPARIRVNQLRSAALASRRSPTLASFAAGAPGSTSSQSRFLAERSGQDWLMGADRLETWTVHLHAPPTAFAQAMWEAHRGAARLTYEAALSGRWRCRPVSGFAATAGSWVIHALAMLEAGDEGAAP